MTLTDYFNTCLKEDFEFRQQNDGDGMNLLQEFYNDSGEYVVFDKVKQYVIDLIDAYHNIDKDDCFYHAIISSVDIDVLRDTINDLKESLIQCEGPCCGWIDEDEMNDRNDCGCGPICEKCIVKHDDECVDYESKKLTHNSAPDAINIISEDVKQD